MSRRRGAVLGAVVAVLLWQLSAELQYLTVGAWPPSLLAWLPSGSPFPLAAVPMLVPNAGGYVGAALLTAAALGVGVWLLVGSVVSDGFRGVREFLAIWMSVVLVGAVAAGIGAGLQGAMNDGAAILSGSAFRGGAWGLASGWLVALIVGVAHRTAAIETTDATSSTTTEDLPR